jgi:16S rRNA (cytidine1402-2'-O)-methyltransferase
VVVAPPVEADLPEAESDADLDARLDRALAASSFKQAVADVAAATGLPRRRVYARALARKSRS